LQINIKTNSVDFFSKFDREWKATENRANTLIFIGKNLDRAALTEGFKACLAG